MMLGMGQNLTRVEITHQSPGALFLAPKCPFFDPSKVCDFDHHNKTTIIDLSNFLVSIRELYYSLRLQGWGPPKTSWIQISISHKEPILKGQKGTFWRQKECTW
jgi:hypothetical protein